MQKLRLPLRAKVFGRLLGVAYRPHAQNGLPKMSQEILAKESSINDKRDISFIFLIVIALSLYGSFYGL